MTSSVLYDPLDPATIADPYPIYAQMREQEPVLWHDGMGAWVLTRYEDCREVLVNNQVFARDRRRAGGKIADRWVQIQTDDPPANASLRGALRHSISLEHGEAICQRAAAEVAKQLARLGDGERIEAMSELAAPASLQITCEVHGVTPPPLDEYIEIFTGLALSMDAGLDPSRAQYGISAASKFTALMAQWFDSAREGGLIHAAREIGAAHEAPPRYVENTMCATFNASFSTLFVTTGSVLLTLARQPELLEQLRDESVFRTAIDELVRYSGSAQGSMRWATEDTILNGMPIRRGDGIVILFSAANRDPTEFPNPDRVDLARRPNRHLAFGWGAHSCSGANLGQTWVGQLIKALTVQSPRLQLAESPKYYHLATVRGLERLALTGASPS